MISTSDLDRQEDDAISAIEGQIAGLQEIAERRRSQLEARRGRINLHRSGIHLMERAGAVTE